MKSGVGSLTEVGFWIYFWGLADQCGLLSGQMLLRVAACPRACYASFTVDRSLRMSWEGSEKCCAAAAVCYACAMHCSAHGELNIICCCSAAMRPEGRKF
jgi:hypothetical protein